MVQNLSTFYVVLPAPAASFGQVYFGKKKRTVIEIYIARLIGGVYMVSLFVLDEQGDTFVIVRRCMRYFVQCHWVVALCVLYAVWGNAVEFYGNA